GIGPRAPGLAHLHARRIARAERHRDRRSRGVGALGDRERGGAERAERRARAEVERERWAARQLHAIAGRHFVAALRALARMLGEARLTPCGRITLELERPEARAEIGRAHV